MKKTVSALLTMILITGSLSSCGPKCKKCYTEIMGTRSPAKELCGDELEAVEKTGTLICE